MSSANPTRIDEFYVFVLRLYFLLPILLLKALTICLFQPFKERMLYPVGVAVRLILSLFFFSSIPFLAIGSAKVSRSFEPASEEVKFLFFLRLTFQSVSASCRSGVQR